MREWLARLDRLLPVRYAVWLLCALATLLSLLAAVTIGSGMLPVLLFSGLTLLGWRDTRQTRRSVLRNYPVIGHVRYLLEYIRPEIRQYFIEPDHESAPFSRQQRSLVYQRAKVDSDKRPFGTQMNVHANGYEWINHSIAPTRLATHDFRVTIGAGRAQPYSASIFNISAMSFGSLSANAILALNGGAQARQLRARHRRRVGQPVPPRARRRPDLGDRLGLLRLPRRRRPLRCAGASRPPRAMRR